MNSLCVLLQLHECWNYRCGESDLAVGAVDSVTVFTGGIFGVELINLRKALEIEKRNSGGNEIEIV